MCLAIPMQIDSIDGFLARCSTKGVSRDVNLFLLQDRKVSVGDHVLVHLGYAIEIIDVAEARRYWEVFDAALDAIGERADA
ncbi:MAG: HypC/HybG/HupF family hydrogenase formation chaperone [Xanthobacteraceae bacterium]|nr:HypC/HybG/HupF family hydrogenase formation chaperone [Xanthobacteraceae bacterium]